MKPRMPKHSNGVPSSSDWVDYKGTLALKSYYSEFHHITDAAFIYNQVAGNLNSFTYYLISFYRIDGIMPATGKIC